ncbi:MULTISPECIES: hypothetical protein [Nocardiopsis]
MNPVVIVLSPGNGQPDPVGTAAPQSPNPFPFGFTSGRKVPLKTPTY